MSAEHESGETGGTLGRCEQCRHIQTRILLDGPGRTGGCCDGCFDGPVRFDLFAPADDPPESAPATSTSGATCGDCGGYGEYAGKGLCQYVAELPDRESADAACHRFRRKSETPCPNAS